MTCREAEPLLHAHADNELDIAGAANVERHLSECRACAAQYAELRGLRQEIAAAGLAYTPPSGLERRLAAKLPRQNERTASSRSYSWRTAFLAAAAACIVLGVLLAVLLASPMRSARDVAAMDSEILDNHLSALELGRLVDVPSSDQHTVKPWFQGKTSFSPPVPDLASDGFILAGGRLEVIHQQPSAAIVYRRRQHVISLYVSPGTRAETEIESSDLGGYHVLHWEQNGMSYRAVSDVAVTDLREFAELIRAGGT